MAFAVGVDFGSTKTTVAISTWDDDGDPETEPARVAVVVPSVVFLGEHHDVAIGDHAQKLGSADPHRVIRDFKRRLGDSVPIFADGWCESTEAVVAALVRQVIDEVSDQQGATPDAVAVAYPAHWGPYKQALLAGSLREAGLVDVLLVTEPAAAVTGAELSGTGPFGTVLVYDLGAGSFDGAIMSRDSGGEFELIGIPQGIDRLGGDDFDQAIFSRVRHSAHLERVDGTDAETLIQMGRLREACTAAKESLSLDTEVTIPVTTPRFRTQIRMVRAEFEELIRDAIEDTLDATRRVISAAGLSVTDLDAIVLIGGSSRIPLVAQMISAEFALPIIIGGRPEASVSLGAAMIAAATLRAELAPPEMDPAPAEAEQSVVSVIAERQWLSESNPPTDAHDSSAAARPDRDRPPIPAAAGDAPNSMRHDGTDHNGRRRQRARRRYGLRTAGIVAAVGALIFAGSSLAASPAADSTVSPTGVESGPPATTTAPPTMAAPRTTTAQQAVSAGEITVAPLTTPARQTPAGATATATTVDAPAVVVDQSPLGGTDGSR